MKLLSMCPPHALSPTSIMPWIAYFIAGGKTFLPGAGLLALAVISSSISLRRSIGSMSFMMAVVGIAMVAISAEAIPFWIYWIWIAWTSSWLLRGVFKSRHLKSAIDLGELAITFSAVATALPFQLRPSLPTAAFSRLYVVGDSISAGIGTAHGTTWPVLLGAEHRVQVVDLARAGATIADATRRLQSEPLGDGLVLLEVGGNDLIGHASPDQFGRDLSALARLARGPKRQVVIVELPLFPLDNCYGIQQRRVASQYGCVLIPRRYLTQVLASPGATLDGIHLSPIGQRLMAEMIWGAVGGSLRKSS